jgi:hypothetical protein
MLFQNLFIISGFLQYAAEYEQVTVSLLEVVIQTGIFGATAYALMDLLGKCYFFLDAEKFMDPAWEPVRVVSKYSNHPATLDPTGHIHGSLFPSVHLSHLARATPQRRPLTTYASLFMNVGFLITAAVQVGARVPHAHHDDGHGGRLRDPPQGDVHRYGTLTPY